MNRDKQIEEMSRDVCTGVSCTSDCYAHCRLSANSYCRDVEVIAEARYNAGYRKASEVVEDIFSDFESILFSLMYLDFDGKYHLRKMNGDRATKIFERYYQIKKKYESEGEENV